ncbi:MAG: hypothetical protein JWO38_3510 [Gemmataceae bacterium]|nr:hypothetical protein [Gemmataceae bacterium]
MAAGQILQVDDATHKASIDRARHPRPNPVRTTSRSGRSPGQPPRALSRRSGVVASPLPTGVGAGGQPGPEPRPGAPSGGAVPGHSGADGSSPTRLVPGFCRRVTTWGSLDRTGLRKGAEGDAPDRLPGPPCDGTGLPAGYPPDRPTPTKPAPQRSTGRLTDNGGRVAGACRLTMPQIRLTRAQMTWQGVGYEPPPVAAGTTFVLRLAAWMSCWGVVLLGLWGGDLRRRGRPEYLTPSPRAARAGRPRHEPEVPGEVAEPFVPFSPAGPHLLQVVFRDRPRPAAAVDEHVPGQSTGVAGFIDVIIPPAPRIVPKQPGGPFQTSGTGPVHASDDNVGGRPSRIGSWTGPSRSLVKTRPRPVPISSSRACSPNSLMGWPRARIRCWARSPPTTGRAPAAATVSHGTRASWVPSGRASSGRMTPARAPSGWAGSFGNTAHVSAPGGCASSRGPPRVAGFRVFQNSATVPLRCPIGGRRSSGPFPGRVASGADHGRGREVSGVPPGWGGFWSQVGRRGGEPGGSAHRTAPGRVCS